MSAKAMTPDQCRVLHLYYPPPNCCLCNSRTENTLLKEDIKWLLSQLPDLKKYPNTSDYQLARDCQQYNQDRVKLIKDRYGLN